MTDAPQNAPARQTTAYLKELFGQVGFTIDARRGQNFLVDLNLLDLLERSAGITAADVVLEVGAGTGLRRRNGWPCAGRPRGDRRGGSPARPAGPRTGDRL